MGGKGCAPPPPPPPPSLPYDCAAGFANWQAGWSEPKKVWCCHHQGKGCASGARLWRDDLCTIRLCCRICKLASRLVGPEEGLVLPAPGQRLRSNAMPYKPLRRKAFVFRGARSAPALAPSSGVCKFVDSLLHVGVLP